MNRLGGILDDRDGEAVCARGGGARSRGPLEASLAAPLATQRLRSLS